MHILLNYECNHDGLKGRSRSISLRNHDANKQKHHKWESYGNCEEWYGEHSRKYRRLKCESGFKNTSSYDERDKLHRKQNRMSRSRSTSKPPIEGNRTDQLKQYWSEDYRQTSKSWSRSPTPQRQFINGDEMKQQHHHVKKSCSKSRSRSKSPWRQYTHHDERRQQGRQWMTCSKWKSTSKSSLNIRKHSRSTYQLDEYTGGNEGKGINIHYDRKHLKSSSRSKSPQEQYYKGNGKKRIHQNWSHSKSRSMSRPWQKKKTYQNEMKSRDLWEYRSHSKIRSRSRSQILDKSSEPNEWKQKCRKESWRRLKSSSRSRSRSPLHQNRRNELKQIHSQDYREQSKSKSRSKTPGGQYTSWDERKGICCGTYRSHSKSRSRSKSATHEQYTSQYPINDNEEITLSSIKARQSPNVIHVKLPKLCNQGNVEPIMID